jgi:hypothetical protein
MRPHCRHRLTRRLSSRHTAPTIRIRSGAELLVREAIVARTLRTNETATVA